MKITTQTTHEISFDVKAFEGEEGGMHVLDFGESCKELPAALRLLELARVQNPKVDWVIVLDVAVVTNPVKANAS